MYEIIRKKKCSKFQLIFVSICNCVTIPVFSVGNSNLIIDLSNISSNVIKVNEKASITL